MPHRVSDLACEAPLPRRGHYRWLDNDADYRCAFDETREESFDLLCDRASSGSV
jgi:hypothetical protein